MKKSLLSLALILCFALPGAAKALYTLKFGKDFNQESVSAYNKTWQVKVDDNTWTIENFNNNNNGWSYVRCGSKNSASVAKITTDFAIPGAVNYVTAIIDKITATSINSIKLETSESADFAAIAETVNIASDNFKTGDMVFNLTAPKANLYYRLTFDCAKGSANGLIQLSAVTYNDNAVADLEEVADLATFIKKADSANAVIVKGDVEVINQIDYYLYVKDASARLLIYGKPDKTYKPGDVIPGGFQGKYSTYGGLPQMVNATNLADAAKNNEVTIREVKLSEITADDVFDFVEIKGVSISNVNGNNFTLKQGETDFAGYKQFYSVTLPSELDGKTFDVKAMIGSYNGNIQVQPVEIIENSSSAIDEIGVDENAPVEFFNLQGVRVENPENGIFVRRQGGKVSKVVIR